MSAMIDYYVKGCILYSLSQVILSMLKLP